MAKTTPNWWHSHLKISATNSLINHEFQSVVMARIIKINEIGAIRFQFR